MIFVRRYGITIVSVLLLFLWGAVSLYFYSSDRLRHYLPPVGIFRPLVLWSGIGMLILGLFNLLTIRSKEADCGHDHGHDHDHSGGGCCGHDHDHDHDHDHAHHHHGDDCCGHDHGQKAVAAKHDHAHTCCSHDHHHGHSEEAHHHHHHEEEHSCCGHDHQDDGKAHSHEHAHGILDESGTLGKIFAIFILAVPVSYAAIRTPDQFSANAVINKGLYSDTNNFNSARADQFSLRKKLEPGAGAADSLNTDPNSAPDMAPPVTITQADRPPGEVPVPSADKVPETESQKVKSYGSFTLKDLEAQIPKSPEGNFMLEVPEIYYTAGDKELQSVIKGQPVETIAQILPEKAEFNPDGNRVRIFRMQVQCCAADARPFSVPVAFPGKPPQFKDMSWVKISGQMNYLKDGDQITPIIENATMTDAAEPVDRAIY